MKMCLQLFIELPENVEARAAMNAADDAAKSFAETLGLTQVPEHEWMFSELAARGTTSHGG